jgi:hypothetical protein
MRIFKPPYPIEKNGEKSIFLAGTIEMGNSKNWQEEVCLALTDKPYNIYNPRRDDWDASWKPDRSDFQFNEQVNWELDALEQSDLVIMNFLPGSRSPVTLIEFGLLAKTNKLMVCCHRAFWRSGNIHVVCEKYKAPLFEDLEELLLNISL